LHSLRFIHLHTHSAYSLSEGAITIKQMAKLASAAEMPALAITDTGNLFGALEFSEALKEQGLQPVIGVQLKVALDASAPQPQTGIRKHPSLVLLAKSQSGYNNLMKLVSRSFLDAASNEEPHVSWDLLAANADGLICLTGGPQGPLNDYLQQGQQAHARTAALKLKQLFGDNLYIELQRHGLPLEQLAEPGLIDIAYEEEIPLVATNEPYFATTEDFQAHDALLCIADGELISNEDRRRLTPEHYFKSQAEMAALFADIPEALENTIEIAKRCSYFVKGSKPLLPRFGTGDEAQELRDQSHAGLTERIASRGLIGELSEEDYRKRLDFELDVIIRMEFPGYFLIVADFIRYAKTHDIPVGPGRGSGAGSLVAYALTITDLDPFRFNLLFERFLNPERVSMPDFDIDFCQERRDEVISYVQTRYGEDKVAQIITFGKLQARMVTRDVGRVLQMPYGHVDRLSKMIPMNPANPMTLQQAIDSEPRLQHERDTDPNVAALFDIALRLEGLYRNASTHAAGVVIGDRPLEQLVPLYRDPRSAIPATQFNMKYVEKAGLVKFDFLGLKTLTVIQKAQRLIHQRALDFNVDKIPYDDKKTFDMLAQGDTVGVFQLESSGMRDTARKLRADCVEDIIAIVALFRPGPMENIPLFIANKLGEKQPDYLHPSLEPILKETYGVIVYQEQVMQIAQVLSGYSLGEADLLRRAMGKKIKAEMDAQKDRFVKGAVERGVAGDQADFIFELVEKFAGYGFNKSHAAAYAVVSYQTAYLKANYPVEFLAASMSLDASNTDKLMVFRSEAQRLGIKIAPPSVNEGDTEFAVRDGAIIYALAALRNVGSGAIQHIVDVRKAAGKFKSLPDFARRIDARQFNRRALESLIKAGAFDAIHPNRAQLMQAIDSILAVANRAALEQASGQNDMFGGVSAPTNDFPMAVVDAWLPMEKLQNEFDAIGFHLSGHPLDDYLKPLQRINVDTWEVFRDKVLNRGATAGKIAGTLTAKQERRSKQGNKFAFISFSDPTGQFETVCFADTLSSSRELLEPGKSLVLRVEAELQGEDVKLRINSVEPVDQATKNAVPGIQIFLRDAKPIDSVAQRLQRGGKAPVRVTLLQDQGKEIDIAIGDKFIMTPQIKSAIKAIAGVVHVEDM
jgi:DNA polymerase III subunit alpha